MLNARTIDHRRKAHSAGSGGGGGEPTAQLNSGDYYSTHSGNGGNGLSAKVQFNVDGTMTVNDPSFSSAAYLWRIGGAGADYQIRADVVSGSVSGSATGSWLSLSAARSWSKGGAFYYHYAQLTLRLRRASDFVEVDTCTVSLGYEGPEPEGDGGFA